MPYRRMSRRRNFGQVIHSVKNVHETDISLIANANQITSLALGVDVGVPTKVTGIEVPTGAKIYSIELWITFVAGASNETGVYNWYIGKIRAGQSSATDFPIADGTDIGLNANRNFIFHEEHSIVGTEDAGPYKFHRRIKIPKIYQRMRSSDSLFIKSKNDIAGLEQVVALYKYYT